MDTWSVTLFYQGNGTKNGLESSGSIKNLFFFFSSIIIVLPTLFRFVLIQRTYAGNCWKQILLVAGPVTIWFRCSDYIDSLETF